MRESWKDPSILSLHNFGICFVIKKKENILFYEYLILNTIFSLNTILILAFLSFITKFDFKDFKTIQDNIILLNSINKDKNWRKKFWNMKTCENISSDSRPLHFKHKSPKWDEIFYLISCIYYTRKFVRHYLSTAIYKLVGFHRLIYLQIRAKITRIKKLFTIRLQIEWTWITRKFKRLSWKEKFMKHLKYIYIV